TASGDGCRSHFLSCYPKELYRAPSQDRKPPEEQSCGLAPCLAQTAFPQHPDTFVGVLDAQESHLPAWFEHPRHLPRRLLPTHLARDVMQDQGGNDHVERSIREGQLPGVGLLHLDALRHPFEPCVLQGRFRPIADHALPLPDINANRLARRQPPGSPDEQEPPPATDIEDGFIPAPGEQVKEALPLAHLADLAVPEHASHVDQEVHSKYQADLTEGDAEG